jgi:hypothetical protein
MIAALNRLAAMYYKYAARRLFAGFAYDLLSGPLRAASSLSESISAE